MAKQKHLSRLAAPKTWPVVRKSTKWIAKPVPGPHSTYLSMPLQTYLTDILQLAKTKSEVKKILNQGAILVNCKARKELRFPVGLFDTLQIQKYDKTYRVLLSKGQLKPIEIPKAEANIMVTRISRKTTLKGRRTQIALSNGWTFIPSEDVYKIGDTLLFDTAANKPIKCIKLERNNIAYVAGGAHAGFVGQIINFVEEGRLRKKKYAVLSSNSIQAKIPLKEIFMVGEEKPEITLP